MVSFSTKEIFTATDVVRSFSSILTKITKKEMGRAVIVKNNRFEAVLLHIDEYERLNEAVEKIKEMECAFANKGAANGD